MEINWCWKDQIWAVKLIGRPPNKKELHELDEIKAYFEILTDKIIELIKEVRAKKVDSIPQTNVTK